LAEEKRAVLEPPQQFAACRTTDFCAMLKHLLLMSLCVLLLACQPKQPAQAPVTLADEAGTTPPRVTSAPLADPIPGDYLKTTYWPTAELDVGQAWISCEYDYETFGDGERLESLTFFSVVDALTPCQPKGVVRLRYDGKIGAGFTALVQRVAAIADRMEIRTRILDINSTGGHVEEAIRAGDSMAETRWAIWVRDDSQCHSSCVLILAGGDMRSIAGKVGVHRLFRDQSTATSRAELSAELKDVSTQVREYLARNGADTRIADLMMTVANRRLRLLTEDELREYGLSGSNAVQDDLDRIRLTRRCGDDFARRRDAWLRAFENQCLEPGKAYEDVDQCGRALEPNFGFPDPKCPGDNPTADRRGLPSGSSAKLLRPPLKVGPAEHASARTP
jgi:ATP-dependent protease ClpP protease subunit